MCIMDTRQALHIFKPPKMFGFRDFPEGCGLNVATTDDNTSKSIVQQSSKPESPTRENTNDTQYTHEAESELTARGYRKRKKKFAIRSSPRKDIHIKKVKTGSFPNEADDVPCSSDDVSEDLGLWEKSESSEKYGVRGDSDKTGEVKLTPNVKNGMQYESNLVSSREYFARRGKKKVGSNGNITPEKVKKALSLFRSVCRSLEEEKVKPGGIKCTRIDFRAAHVLRDSLKNIRIDKPFIGAIPGVEVNDHFLYRAELGIVGIHRPPQSGIDCLNQNGTLLATSVVDSGGYANYRHDLDTLVYVGQGGRVTKKNKVPEDQVLEKGNLALRNSMIAGNPIRVLRKVENLNARCRKDSEMYTYDGLYIVVEYWHELGDFDKRVYKFRLVRLPRQDKLPARRNTP